MLSGWKELYAESVHSATFLKKRKSRTLHCVWPSRLNFEMLVTVKLRNMLLSIISHDHRAQW